MVHIGTASIALLKASCRGLTESLGLRRRFVGVEFAVTHSEPPNLFIIEKRDRLSPTETRAIACFYVLNNSIYQAPDLYSVLSNRLVSGGHGRDMLLSDVNRLIQVFPCTSCLATFLSSSHPYSTCRAHCRRRERRRPTLRLVREGIGTGWPSPMKAKSSWADSLAPLVVSSAATVPRQCRQLLPRPTMRPRSTRTTLLPRSRKRKSRRLAISTSCSPVLSRAPSRVCRRRARRSSDAAAGAGR